MLNTLEGSRFNILNEKVLLKGLTYREYTSLQDNDYRTEYLFYYDVGRIGIKHFKFVDQFGLLCDYNTEDHFGSLFESNYPFVKECCKAILEQLTLVLEEEKNQIKAQVYFNYYLSENESAFRYWECDYCIEAKFTAKRKCKRFDKETIERIMKEGYNPLSKTSLVLSKEEKEKENKRNTEEELDSGRKQILARRKRISLKDKLDSQRKRKQERLNKQKEIMPKGKTSSFVLKSKYYTWESCPISYAPSVVMKNYSIACRSIDTSTMLTEGGLFNQPFKFVEVVSIIKSTRVEVQNREHKDSIAKNKNKKKSR